MALSAEQRQIVQAIRREGRKIRDPRVRRIFERAAVQTGLVESNLRNLPGGDADSQGWRQERSSLYRNPRNVGASVRRFREEFEQHYNPGERSYEVAAQVQRPAAQYRGRYKQRAGDAARILGGSPRAGGNAPEAAPDAATGDTRKAVLSQYLLERGRPDALLRLGSGLAQASEAPVDEPAAPKAREPSVKSGGGWAGTQKVAESAARGFAFTGKRSPGRNAAVGGSPTSDHLTTNRGSYAVDIGASGGQGDQAARRIAQRLGLDGWRPGTFDRHTIKVGGRKFSVQLLWKVAGHHDHVHLGIRRVA